MIHHPIVLVPKLVVLAIIIVILVILHGVLPPDQFLVAVWIAIGTFAVFCIVLWTVVFRMLKNPESWINKVSVLSHRARSEDGFTASSNEYADLVGKRGVAVTPLNPSGKAAFDGKRIVVLADGEYIDAGSPVEVIEARGAKVVVAAVREDEDDSSAPR